MDSARLSRIQLDGNQMVGDEQVLIEDWCQQGPTHTIGDLHFGADGALYVSGGEAASPDFVDYGQAGIPLNPCDDPPVAVGEHQTAPSAQGGALRSQDLRTPSDPTRSTAASCGWTPTPARASRPTRWRDSPDPDARRIVAYGLRNPFRFASGPGPTRCGPATWAGTPPRRSTASSTRPTVVENFGWPCYEGLIRQGGYDSPNLSVCETLYGSGSVDLAVLHLRALGQGVPRGDLPRRQLVDLRAWRSTRPGARYPAEFDGALFFADYARKCIWVMERSGGSLPNPSRVRSSGRRVLPVDIQFGPGGDLFYADVWGGTIKRIHYTDGNQAPKAVASASATHGATPLVVTFDGSGSSDPDTGDIHLVCVGPRR